MANKRSEEVRLPISFKKNAKEIAIYNFIKEESEMIGQSTYIKMLVLEEMKRQGKWTE
jgi:virulence-associated protein VagC